MGKLKSRGRPRIRRPDTALGRFGASLAAMREARGISVRELARACQVKTCAIWAWEGGRYRPAASSIRRLALALDVPADGLLEALYP